jgi:hypothetical protein
VGDSLGATVGEVVNVGTVTGELVGGSLGDCVGVKLGEAVGDDVGAKLGEALGCVVGAKELFPSGLESTVGACDVGPAVSLTVGDSVAVSLVGNVVATDGLFVVSSVGDSVTVSFATVVVDVVGLCMI